MYSLCWSIDELGRLNERGREMYVEIASLIELLNDHLSDIIATHVLVTMISPSQRNRKPYALPNSCIPYHSLTESKARAHINCVITQMKKRNMKVAGVYM